MATAEFSNGSTSPSQPTSFPLPHQMSPAPTMSNTSTQPTPPTQPSQTTFTPAQLEARAILTHLLTQLSQPPPSPSNKPHPHDKYAPWITHHSIPALTSTLYSLIRPQIWSLLSTRLSLDALKNLSSGVSGDLRHSGRAIYLNGILGVDKRLRIYIGQSANLRMRVAQHLNFRYRRDHACLHYWALEWSVYNIFGVCAVVPDGGSRGAGMEEVELVMNVLEMWMCLVFRTLPEDMLGEWLPDDEVRVARKRLVAKEGVVGGLNVASPLDQGVEMRERAFVDLSGETDPVVVGYLKEVQRKKGEGVVGEGVKEKKMSDGEVEVDEEERALRKKMYAEKARRYQRKDTDIVIPQWVFLGAVAVGVGIMLLRSSGGPQAKGRWR